MLSLLVCIATVQALHVLNIACSETGFCCNYQLLVLYCCRIARAVLPSGDASLTYFNVISNNEKVVLEGYTYGLVASEATNQTR